MGKRERLLEKIDEAAGLIQDKTSTGINISWEGLTISENFDDEPKIMAAEEIFNSFHTNTSSNKKDIVCMLKIMEEETHKRYKPLVDQLKDEAIDGDRAANDFLNLIIKD